MAEVRQGGPGGPGARRLRCPVRRGPRPVPAFGVGFGRLGALALDPVAKALGITTDELKTDLAKGQTIAADREGARTST